MFVLNLQLVGSEGSPDTYELRGVDVAELVYVTPEKYENVVVSDLVTTNVVITEPVR